MSDNNVVNTEQFNSSQDVVINELEKSYEDWLITDDDLEVMMFAEDEHLSDEERKIAEADFARQIVEDCQGVTEDGDPNSAVSLMFEMVNIGKEHKRMVAQQAMYKPIVAINKRMDFIEMLLTFPTAQDSNLRVLMINLDKYNTELNKITENSAEVPFMSFVVMPLVSLGTYYMVLNHPVMWALTSEKIGGSLNQVKIVFRCEDVGFCQTDEIDVAANQASIQREIDANTEAIARMEEKEKQKQEYAQMLEGLKDSVQE